MSSSRHNGSSGWNCTTPRPGSVCAAVFDIRDALMATRRTMAIDLEDMFEPQERHETFATERQVEPTDKCTVTVEAETDAVGCLHVAERQVSASRRDRARVDEQGSVKCPPRFPPVPGAEEQRVVVSKGRLAEPAEIPVPSERRLKIEGHGLAAVSIR